jgi:ABC-2 type transport system permease protein
LPLTTFVVCLAGPRFALVPDWKALGGVTITLTLLALDFGLCAMFVGALTGSRGAATGAATAAAAAAYLISSLAPVVPQLGRSDGSPHSRGRSRTISWPTGRA